MFSLTGSSAQGLEDGSVDVLDRGRTDGILGPFGIGRADP